MTTIHIPPAALEAGARVICNTDNPLTMAEARDLARAAFLAIVKAWPGASAELSDTGKPHLILPLPPQENNNG